MKTRLFIVTLALAFIITSCGNNKNAEMKTGVDSVSYAIAISVGKNIKRDFKEKINTELFYQALEEVYTAKSDSDLTFTPDEAQKIIYEFFQKERKKAADKNMKESADFLEKNKAKEGVVALPSGLQYKIINKGTGETPNDSSIVKVHYKGTLIDGREFDSSLGGEPRDFMINQTIPGFKEALTIMPVGSKWELYVPANLAYGENPYPGSIIEGNMALIFEIELLSIVAPEKNEVKKGK